MVECDPLDESNRSYSATLTYHGFNCNFTWSESRRMNAYPYSYDGDFDELVSARARYEERRMLLIENFTLMHHNSTLQCSVR